MRPNRFAPLALVLLACEGSSGDAPRGGDSAGVATKPAAPSGDAKPAAATAPPARVAKLKPPAGKGNVQGEVRYDDKPAAGIEVKLCAKFNQFLGGCQDETHAGKTDADGVYVVDGVAPGTYETLMVKVFDTPSWVFMTEGIVGSKKYDILADQTLFVDVMHLFKSDIKVQAPKAGAKIDAKAEWKWDAYPSASYYKLSAFPETEGGKYVPAPYVSKKIDGTSFSPDDKLFSGSFRLELEAYNSTDHKIADNGDDHEFTVTGGAAPPASP